jgi:hypothetical protein
MLQKYLRQMKKNFRWLMLITGMVAAGCAAKNHQAAVAPNAQPISTAVVTPEAGQTAKVISVNNIGRFVVLNFPAGQLPKLQSSLFLYRAGLKVAEIKITGPEDGNNTVGDLISGDANPGDTVRDE